MTETFLYFNICTELSRCNDWLRYRIPVGTRFSARPDRSWVPPSLPYNRYRVLPGGRGGRGVGLTPPTPTKCRGPRKSRAIPILTLRACVAYKKGDNLHNTCTLHLLLFCAPTNKYPIISQTITLLPHISRRSCHWDIWHTWNILIINYITSSGIWHTWQDINHELSEDDTIVSKHVGGVW